MSGRPLEDMVKALSRLPGLGPRSGRRLAFHLLSQPEKGLAPLLDVLETAQKHVSVCETCGSIDDMNPCHICQNPKRQESQLCIVADVSDLWAMERTHSFNGKYIVLGGLLSALDGRGPESLNLPLLRQKMASGMVEEVILALNATVEGQTTAHFITDELSRYDIKITALAHGVPVGGELDYLDDSTLQTALARRRSLL